MRDALTLALENYTGAVILVSHDRSLVRAVADELWLVADGKIQPLDGDLEDYKKWLENRRAADEATTKSAPQKTPSHAAIKPNKKTLLSKQSKLEAAIASAQQELSEINRRLADPATTQIARGKKLTGLI